MAPRISKGRNQFATAIMAIGISALLTATVITSNGTFIEPAAAATDEKIESINEDLRDRGLNIALAEIDYFTIGKERPSDRILQQPFRWVPDDSRRDAAGTDLTYLVDMSDGSTSSGLSSTQTEDAIDIALNTLEDARCLDLDVLKRTDDGADPDILDGLFGFGQVGNPFVADIINAGWITPEFFDAVAGPGGGENILAGTATFVFTDEDGNPTDINGDNYLDVALAEVYYNDAFGKSGETREENPWEIEPESSSAIDVETVALHENAHGFDLGHFGPPPEAVMNPRYDGIRQELLSADQAALCTTWGSWPWR